MNGLAQPTPEALLQLLLRSGLFAGPREAELRKWYQHHANQHRDSQQILCELTQMKWLTPFQAEHLAEGRWRGLIIPPYVLHEKLGEGGMGRVYLAEHQTLQRRVAIKVLFGPHADNPVARERLIREARAAVALNHPNIVRVFDIDVEHSPPFLVMELLEGISLQAAVARTGTLRFEAAAACGHQIALALQHAADHGLVHRDVKPANLLLNRKGCVKLLDLGIVRSDHEPSLTVSAHGNRSILGTVDYLAPEQSVDSSAVDSRADIYSLGATIYFLLVGHPPFPEGSTTERLLAKCNQDPPPVHHLRPDISVEFSDVIARMLARKPEDRYSTPAAAAAALEPWAVPCDGFPDSVFAAPRERQPYRPVAATCIQAGVPTQHCLPDLAQPTAPASVNEVRLPIPRPPAPRVIETSNPILLAESRMGSSSRDSVRIPSDTPKPDSVLRQPIVSVPNVPRRPTSRYTPILLAGFLGAVLALGVSGVLVWLGGR